MTEDLRFLVKLFAASIGLATAIKYGGPLLPLPDSSPVALIIVLLPPVTLGFWMAWRLRQPVA